MNKDHLKIFLLFLVLGFFLYTNSFHNQLFWDDNDNIVNNVYIRSWRFLPRYFSQNLIAGAGLHSNYWRPALLFSFSLDYKIWKLNPLGYHLTNTLLHIFDAFLIYYLLLLLFKKRNISFLTALIFLLHPLQTEAVTYVSGRGDPLSIFFILLAFIFYIYCKEKKRLLFLFLSSFFFILSLLTKESVIFFPALLFLYEILFNKRDKLKSILLRLSPLLFIGLGYFLLRLTLLNFGQTLNLYGSKNLFTSNIQYRTITFLNILLTYYSLYFFPLHLHMERSAPILTSPFYPGVIASLFILTLITIVSIYFLRRGNKVFAFAFGWFFISLFPFSNIPVPISGLLYEHWLYFPLIGLSLVLAYLFFELMERLKDSKICQTAVLLSLAFFLIFLSIRTITRNTDWKNPITFYNQTLRYSETARVHNNLAMAYADKGMFRQAIYHYKRAIQISDTYPQIHNNLGNIYRATGKTDEAIREFKKAISMDDSFFIAYNNLARLYLQENKLDKAVGVYKQYLGRFPKSVVALYNLGVVYYNKKDYDNAILVLRRILEIEPANKAVSNLILKIGNEKSVSK